MKWISVKTIPAPEEWVLLYAQAGEDQKFDQPFIFVGKRGNYSEDDYCSAHGDGWIPFDDDQITHWMALPEPPKQEEKP